MTVTATGHGAAERTLRIATRASAQARTQAQSVADALTAAHPGLTVELVFVDTTGDQRQDVPLHSIGGQGVFVKEVQRAVLDGRADLAAHSAKDMPSAATDGLVIGAFCERRTANDALIGCTLSELAQGATVATGSVRRRSQLGLIRPDLDLIELRGNIQTRLSKIPDGGAILMAVAALEILGMTDRIAQVLPIDSFIPAVGQGCVAVECADDAGEVRELLSAVDHAPTRRAVEAERAFLRAFGTGCSLPIGAHVLGDLLHVFLADPSTGRWQQRAVALEPADPSGEAALVAAGMIADLGGR